MLTHPKKKYLGDGIYYCAANISILCGYNML